MNLFTDVKASINTQEAARRYGLEINRYGKALCPFHIDRHPSLYVADDHYYCYACGEHGDVIDLTARLFDLSLYEAAKKLAYDFGISQDKPRQDIRRKKSEAQQLKENERLCFLHLAEHQRRLKEWKVRYAPCSPEDTPDSRHQEACHRLGYCNNRLKVAYNPDAPRPEQWLNFLADLLVPEDIPTLQKYLGYCLIPSTKGQKMLMLIGKGGEGKSRIGLVMRSILGDSMNTTSIQKIENNRFSRADLESKLLMVDDDMDMSALPKTNYIKSIVTAECKMDLERKGVQALVRGQRTQAVVRQPTQLGTGTE